MYLSISVNGADQIKVALTRFVTPRKEQRWHRLCIHLIGVIEHALIQNFRMFTMTLNQATGANHILEVIHLVINDKANVPKVT